MLKLEVIIASTRPGRAGLPIARWFYEHAKKNGTFEVDLADLAVIDLPFLDEPKHPRVQDYEHEHTRAWSRRIDAADAYVIVTPEYNFGTTAPLVNAIDYLNKEWGYKPVGFVSYGGVSGGTRAAEMAKSICTAVRMMPIPEAVHIPFVHELIELEDGTKTFEAPDVQVKAADLVISELAKWAKALKPLHTRTHEPA